MEGTSKGLKNTGQQWRSANKSVVHKANLSTTFTKKSLRANNRALARALSKKKQEISALFSNYVKLQGETNLLRLHVKGCDLEMSKFYAEKFLQFRNTVGDAVKLLHGVCGQLIDISANFESTSEFFQNMQSISISKPCTSFKNVPAKSVKPAQRVIMSPDQVISEGDDGDDASKLVAFGGGLGVIEEESSQLSCIDEDESIIDEMEYNEECDSNTDNPDYTIDGIDANIVDNEKIATSPICGNDKVTDQIVETTCAEDEGQLEENCLKNKISSKKKSYISKPGHMKYNSVRPALENLDKLKFKSLAAPRSSVDVADNAGKSSDVKRSRDNPAKETRMSVYDITLDDSSYVVPPIPQPRKGQIPLDNAPIRTENLDKNVPKGEEIVNEAKDDVQDLNEPHGIMLRLGNGARTKPKGKTKSVRYTEDTVATAMVDDVLQLTNIADEVVKTSEGVQDNLLKSDDSVTAPLDSVIEDRLELSEVTKELPLSPALVALKSTENIVCGEFVKESGTIPADVDAPMLKPRDIKTETLDPRDSMDSRCSSEGNTRKRRAASSVNYREPPLNSKLRKGDPHTSTIYGGSSSKKRGKKSTT